nr:S8 family peptidase [Devosia oryzisoli]
MHGVNWAHSAGLTGAGNTVAIVDGGFLTSHREFSGKNITTYGTLPTSDHGTFVASLATANKDGLGIHGVAPGADLHLTSYQPTGAGFSISNVTGGTLDAAAKRAVAQNNSWGFSVKAETFQNYLAGHPGATTADGLNALLGYGAGNWQSYLNALDTFQKTGVIVWALSNDDSYAQGDITATLPYFEPRLAEAWIAAADGYFEVNGSGDITRAVRLSAACGIAAKFCLAGDGITTGAWSTSNTAYASGYGTSFVAPQISGAVALLAEAFPDLTPAEWTKRLLASANNKWFASQGVPVAGTVDYGNGVTHAYSTEWGHGVLDLKAALSPIGTLSMLSGATVETATRYDAAQSAVSAPSSFGDALQVALAPQEMAVFDALNRAYSVPAGATVASAPATLLPRLDAVASLDEEGAGLHMRYTDDLAGVVGGFSGAGGRGSVLGMAGSGMLMASTAPVGSSADLTAYGFAAGHGTLADGSVAGAGVTFSFPVGAGNVRIGGLLADEQGGILGLHGNSAFNFGDASTIGAFNLGVEQAVAPSLSLFGRIEYGAAARRGGGGFVTDLANLSFFGFEVGAALRDVMQKEDRLTLSLSQPLRVETGTVELTTPVGRQTDGTILSRTTQSQLASSGRQLDLGFHYETHLDNRAALNVGMKYAANAGHVAGASGVGLSMGYRQNF